MKQHMGVGAVLLISINIWLTESHVVNWCNSDRDCPTRHCCVDDGEGRTFCRMYGGEGVPCHMKPTSFMLENFRNNRKHYQWCPCDLGLACRSTYRPGKDESMGTCASLIYLKNTMRHIHTSTPHKTHQINKITQDQEKKEEKRQINKITQDQEKKEEKRLINKITQDQEKKEDNRQINKTKEEEEKQEETDQINKIRKDLQIKDETEENGNGDVENDSEENDNVLVEEDVGIREEVGKETGNKKPENKSDDKEEEESSEDESDSKDKDKKEKSKESEESDESKEDRDEREEKIRKLQKLKHVFSVTM